MIATFIIFQILSGNFPFRSITIKDAFNFGIIFRQRMVELNNQNSHTLKVKRHNFAFISISISM